MTQKYSQKEIHIGDGAAIPRRKDAGLFNAWWLTFFGAVGTIIYLCVAEPDPVEQTEVDSDIGRDLCLPL